MPRIMLNRGVFGRCVLGILLLPALFVLGAYSTSSTMNPSVTITSPGDGQTVPTGDVTVTAKVNDFNVVDKQGQANVPGEGHLHFYLDVAAPTAQGKPAIPTSGVWAHVSATTYTFKDVAAGSHDIYVELVNNDHTPLNPPVVAHITITAAPPTGGY